MLHLLLFQYEDDEEVIVWMNTIGPYHNRQETYEYYSLPFCKGTKTTISHYHETLGEALQGVELEFSGLDVKFKSMFLIIVHKTKFNKNYSFEIKIKFVINV